MCLRTDTGCPENRGTTGQLVIVHAKISRRKENNIFHSSLRLRKKRRVLTANFELQKLPFLLVFVLSNPKCASRIVIALKN